MSLLIHKPDRGIKERLSKYSLSYQYVKLHMNMMYDCTCIIKGLHVYMYIVNLGVILAQVQAE